MQVFNTFNTEKMEVEHLQKYDEASQLLNSLNDNFFPCFQNSSKIDETQLFNSLPESVYDSPSPKMKANRKTIEDSLPQYSCSTPPFNRTRTGVSTSSPSSSSSTISTKSGSSNSLNMLIEAISKDNKASLIEQANALSISQSLDRATASRLLHICCEFDSAESAAALLNGEVCGVIPLVNEVDKATGYAPLHTAAENHAVRCIELLIRKRGRTDLKTRKAVTALIGSGNGGMSCNSTSSSRCGSVVAQGLLPLELSLRCVRMDTKWGPEDPLDDLLLILSEKDLRAISVLCEKTKETGEVAYAIAMEGRVAALAALLMVAADKVTGSVLEVRNHSELAAEKMTVYSCVIKEAISIFTLSQDNNGVVEIDHNVYHGVGAKERRALLLREMELLHFFGACHTNNGFMSKKLVSPLILACQAGDEAVMKLLLKTNIDVNEVDSEGNSALKWCLKASKVPNRQQIRILLLLLKHGARVRQKDKFGLTSVHVAAGTGKIDALEILLLRDPDTVHLTSELKETPLFLAAKNDRIDCAQLLLRFGASTEIHNLRRERPIELAKSQQMRAALNRTSLVITNRNSRQKITVQNDEVVSTREVPLKETWSSSESINSSSDGDICKYYTSATGCARGSNCFFKHGEEELGNKKSRSRLARSLALQEFKRKIFVGGLPITIDSESLACIMQEKFGPVVDAKVLEVNIDGQVLSRGFGFVTFTDEKSVNAALDAHYTDILGKKVEMKTAVPKCLLSHDDSEDESLHEEPQNKTVQEEMQQKISQLYSQELGQFEISSDANKPEQISWASGIVLDQPEELVEAHKSRSAVQDMPKWFAVLKKWLPNFLKKMSRNTKQGEFYSLSSLKTDFKALFGLDLDHASLGYPKLSDFIKAYPGLCASKFINTGGTIPNHMILLPPKVSRPRALAVSKIDFSALSDITTAKKHVDHNRHKDVDVAKIESDKDCFSSRSSETSPDATVANAVGGESTVENVKTTATDTLPATNPRFLQFLTPDPIFHARTWRGTGGFKAPDEHFRQKHLVLEHLARKKNDVFFLRSIKFYDDYAASVKRGTCFACGENRLVWANYPCQHLLWCSGCRAKAMRIAEVGTPSHKCVVCDHVVVKIDLVSWSKLQFQSNADTEFPPIHAARLRSQKV
ncbi:uncharacterized protein LOC141611823 isoform X2 [Silene latifolia]|uniref:uncharacterized protein LOC141611823 isoform X2 n=1 Tax=Silene latifolia TaxID=37657 RepID=UPI003D779755